MEVSIRSSLAEEAKQATLPVEAEISINSNVKSFGMRMSPVLSSMESAAYPVWGRYIVIFGVPRWKPMRSYQLSASITLIDSVSSCTEAVCFTFPHS